MTNQYVVRGVAFPIPSAWAIKEALNRARARSRTVDASSLSVEDVLSEPSYYPSLVLAATLIEKHEPHLAPVDPLLVLARRLYLNFLDGCTHDGVSSLVQGEIERGGYDGNKALLAVRIELEALKKEGLLNVKD